MSIIPMRDLKNTVEVERRCARRHLGSIRCDRGEAFAEAQHDARHAAIAHQKVRADADDRHRHLGRGDQFGAGAGAAQE